MWLRQIMNRWKKFFIFAILVVLGWWGYKTFINYRIRKEREQQRVERRALDVAKIATITRQYNAITGWEAKLFDSVRDHILSLEVEDAIVNTGGKPILISKPIDDVARRGDKYFLYVHGPESSIRFILECDSVVAKSIEKDRSLGLNYTIVARIDSVEKAEFQIKPNSDHSEDSMPIEVFTSDVFYARGRCLEIVSTAGDEEINPTDRDDEGY